MSEFRQGYPERLSAEGVFDMLRALIALQYHAEQAQDQAQAELEAGYQEADLQAGDEVLAEYGLRLLQARRQAALTEKIHQNARELASYSLQGYEVTVAPVQPQTEVVIKYEYFEGNATWLKIDANPVPEMDDRRPFTAKQNPLKGKITDVLPDGSLRVETFGIPYGNVPPDTHYYRVHPFDENHEAQVTLELGPREATYYQP